MSSSDPRLDPNGNILVGHGEVFNLINERPIVWEEGGTIHRVEGAKTHPGIILLWTYCQKDVPANAAKLACDESDVNCIDCKRKEK